ncbi:MAG: NAD(+) synthase [Clostridiales bacterium]|nr:NAD(+) synthase [Clostridiales bacterium]
MSNIASFTRVAAASVRVHLGDISANEREIASAIKDLESQGAKIAVFPELCLTGYTLGDLLLHELVQREALAACVRLAEGTGKMAVVVGLPLSDRGRLFNCAAVLYDGKIRGIVPKTYLPNGNEFYETRWFVSGKQASGTAVIAGESVPFRSELLFDLGDCRFAVEICEDLWTPMPPSSRYAIMGADIIVNPSASNALVGKHPYRRELLSQQSARLYAGYAYACAAFGESTSDLVFCGYTAVYENGRALSEGKRFTPTGGQAIADVDVGRLRFQRQRNGSYFQQYEDNQEDMTTVVLCGAASPSADQKIMRTLDPLPFVPTGADASERMDEIVRIQTTGLMTRLDAIGCHDLVVGVSGGLDSTLALLIAVRAYKELGLDLKGIHAITMPGMGTGARTKSNADKLMEALGVSSSEISIEKSVRQHFSDIGHDESTHDVTYENAQARERTQILMDYANKVNGIVLGTGDMSEMALGFCTYNGDHMSMYNVNCSVPKTLVKGLVKYLGETCFDAVVRDICMDIIDTPISPELLPVTEGELSQRTEDILGDYALHDFFLYHMMDSGSAPDKLKRMASQAFEGVYDPEKIATQLATFLRRFFTQQFKRNCVPDGPKVGSIGLSPRGDLRMPSDMSWQMWKDHVISTK